MHRVHNTGATNAMLLNILLVLGIAIAIVVLLFRPPSDEVSSKVTATTSPASTQKVAISNDTPQVNPQQERSPEELEQLKLQLEQEATRLEALRKQEELVEKIRREEAQRQIQLSMAAETDASATEQDEPQQGMSGETEKTQRRLITPMGFPE